jgi:general secretion pathway protein L
MIQRYMTPFLNWWVGQLTGLLPGRLLDAYIAAGDATILEISGDGFVLQARRGGAVECVGEGALDGLTQAMHSIADLPQLRLLRIPEAQALRKTLSLPYATRHDLKNVLSFEIDRETPFEQSEVYWGHAVTGHDAAKSKLEVELVLLPRRVGETLAGMAREAGFDPAALAIGDGGGKTSLLWLGGHNRVPLPRIQPRNKKLMTALYALGAAVLVVPFAVQQVHFFFADRTVAALETKARTASALQQAANRRMAAMEFMGRRNGANGSALKILQAATRTLPDDTFLTALSIHGGQVTMAGSSEVAANLIKAVAKSSEFKDPVFESAVVENPETDLENFTISAKLVGAP